MAYYTAFGLLSFIMATSFYIFIYDHTVWNPYFVWVAACTMTTFIMYGLDKLLAKLRSARIPEFILQFLTILGGFPGAWLGMVLFRHKTNLRRHPRFLPIIILSTLGHGLLTYYWFCMGS